MTAPACSYGRLRSRAGSPEEDLVQMPLQGLPPRPVRLPAGEGDLMARPFVELPPVPELLPQPGTDAQPARAIDGETAPVVHGEHVGVEQQPVVHPLLDPPIHL